MWLDSIPLHLALVGLVAIGGMQDWRKREVSNLLTIPLYLIGMPFALYRFFLGDVVPLAIISLLTLAAFEGWMGGADYKILASLTALWSLGGLVALLAAGIWGGAVVLLTRDRLSTFPGVTAMAFGVALIFLAEIAVCLVEVGGR
jgi:Flp pilus assembly protein protease CpaA